MTTINTAIARRMRHTGQTLEQVLAELEMMRHAQWRYETGNLTDEDRQAIREVHRHWPRSK